MNNLERGYKSYNIFHVSNKSDILTNLFSLRSKKQNDKIHINFELWLNKSFSKQIYFSLVSTLDIIHPTKNCIFRDWVVDRGLYNYPTTCKEPERLSEKMWDVVRSSEFACKVKKRNRFLFSKLRYFCLAWDWGIKRNRLQPTGV